MSLPRPEHPRPSCRREHWQSLNGDWAFEIDNDRTGHARGLNRLGIPLASRITVPFCPESRLSGVGETDFLYGVWYKRTVAVSPHDGILRLHFGAVDHGCTVYVNGQKVGGHVGGYTPFMLDITDAVHEGENELCVYAWDDTRDTTIPSGKQSHERDSFGCFYTRTTGIWQTVWLEYLPAVHIDTLTCDPQNVDGVACFTLSLCGEAPLDIAVTYEGRAVGHVALPRAAGHCRVSVPLTETHLWDVGHGRLYDVTLRFGDDTVHSYFGLRDIRFENGRFLLNGRSVFQRLVLDQGFYPDGIYTAPTDDDLVGDIRLSLAAGFNGARLHEKVFEERFLYHADCMGYLVWGEFPDWGLDHTDPAHLQHILPAWVEQVARDRHHPSIIGWCPRNETWDRGERQQHDDSIALLYRVTKALDPTRPCIDASGNFHVETDIFCVHDYDQDPEAFRKRYAPLAADGILNDKFAERQTYRGEPVFVSEYGGIAWDTSGNGWGYGDGPQTLDDFYERFRGLADAQLDNPALFGLCYTQLTDVEQEQNGLYTYDRRPKFDTARLHAILSRKAAIEED